MATQKQMFPIIYKPGILRDGSFFQGSYCIRGQWVRFFRGQPQNIGGMRNFIFKIIDPDSPLYGQIVIIPSRSYPSSLIIWYDELGQHVLVGISIANGNIPDVDLKTNLIHAIYNSEGQETFIRGYELTNNKDDPARLMQFISVISNINNVHENLILALDRRIYVDITSNLPMQGGVVIKEVEYLPLEFPDFVFKEATGGMIYVGNRLFLYGNNGLVRWSSVAQEKSGQKTSVQKPFLFFEDKYSINISTDKVIYGAEWRGGTNTPTIIFWTLGSVILITNTTGSNNQVIDDPDDLSFSKKVLSRDSSILSSNSVVEYDGIFYWPGTQRFFVFNGVVLPLENNLNRQTFFDSLDMTKRQKVFGVKNVSRDEIWWFYPEKGKADNVGCTRAVIYNVVDNTWYDTGIERDSGYFDNVSGNMYTSGKNLIPYATPPDKDFCYVWQHEVGNDQVNLVYNGEEGSDLAPVKPIPSFFTTPIISYATFNPQKQVAGIDYNIAIERIEPNIVGTKKIKMTVSINTYEYPASTPVTATYNLTEDGELENIIRSAINERKQGRNINFTFKSEGIGSGYQMGTTFVLAEIDDGRP